MTTRAPHGRCEVCGRPLPAPKGTRGRPRLYHPPCKLFADAFGHLTKAAWEVPWTDSASRQWRSELLTLGNTAIRTRVNIERRRKFGRAIRARREELDWSRDQLAARADVPPHRVAHIEAATRGATPTEERALLDALDLELSDAA